MRAHVFDVPLCGSVYNLTPRFSLASYWLATPFLGILVL